MRKKIVVSKCLLGFNCRYDGKNKKNETILKFSNLFEFIPICPEDETLGTPRETMSLIFENSKIELVGNERRGNFTDIIKKYSNKKVKELKKEKIEFFILKSKSPSCGLNVKVYDKNLKLLNIKKSGICAQKVIENFKNTPIIEEINFDNLIKSYLKTV